MRHSVLPLIALAFLLVASPTTRSQLPPPTLTASQIAAADLGRRLDDLRDLLDQVRDASDETRRQAAMHKHWAGMQTYMEQSLQLLLRQSSSQVSIDAEGCHLVGGQWRNLSFPGQVAAADYVKAMQGHSSRMRQDVRAMQTAQQPFVLEAVMREHWRNNYAFLQHLRGLDWMFDRWMPSRAADRRLPEPGAEGAILAGDFCSVCHAVPHARLHTAREWDAVMSEMDRHIMLSDAGVPMCVVAPSAAQLDVIREYLKRNAR